MNYSIVKNQIEKWFSELDGKYEIDHFREFMQSLAEDECIKRIDEIESSSEQFK